MEKVRYGVIGIGNMGSGHVNNLLEGKIPNAVLTSVCDLKQDRLEWAKSAAAKNGAEVVLFTDYKAMIKSGLIDAVIIATPHYLHPVIGIEAFNAGLNVLSEKPIGVYTKKIVEFMETAKKSGKAFGIMYNQRTNPMYQKMREMIQNGDLGELKRCVWIITDWYRTQAYYNSGGWRATWKGEGGGVLLNQCPHNLDLWQWIFGMPNRIHAFCRFGVYHNIEVEDDVTAYAEYPNGATGVFITTTGEYPGTNRLEISGSKGRLIADGDKLIYTKLGIDEREFCFGTTQGFGSPPKETVEIPNEGGGLQHVGILRNYTNHILNGEELLAPGYDGINGLSLSNAMMLSTWKNDWVNLPNDGEEFVCELKKRIAESKGKGDTDGTVTDLSGTYGTP